MILRALIASEILPRLGADDLEVFMRLALCDAVPVGVAERASGRAGTALRLGALVDETAFVVAEGDTVGLVPVFRQALVRWMTTNEPGVAAPTHVRLAQAWLDDPATAQSTAVAVDHLLEAGQFEV